MFKVKVFTVGKCKESWLLGALSEYEKRLKATLIFEWHLAKNDAELMEWVEEEPFVVALDPNGKLFDSVAWSKKLHQLFVEHGSRLSFVIGGSDGLPANLTKKNHVLWSLSPLTFTHQITRLIFVEQIYRALEIEKGTEYHK